MDILLQVGYTIGYELLELSSSIVIMWGVLQCKFKKSIKPYLYAVGIIISILIGTVLSNNQNNLPPICAILELIFIILCFDERVTKKVTLFFFAYICSYVINTLISSGISILFEINQSSIDVKPQWRILIMVFNIIIVSVLTVYIKKYNKGAWVRTISFRYFAVGLPGLVSCALVLVFVDIGRMNPINTVWDKVAVFSVTLVCIFFVVGTVVFILINDSRKYYQLQNQLKEKYLCIQQSYYKQILEKDQEIRKFRHDMKAHMGCMRLLAEDEQYQELSIYIAEVSSEVDRLLFRKYKSGNDTVDALINYLAPEAEKEGATIVLDGAFPPKLKVTGPDLCTVFANAISNAIEACKLMETTENRQIKVNIKMNKDALFITIENPVIKSVDLDLLGKSTTKNDRSNHGFGIQNMIDVVNKYKGDIKFINEAGKFRVEILLLEVL